MRRLIPGWLGRSFRGSAREKWIDSQDRAIRASPGRILDLVAPPVCLDFGTRAAGHPAHEDSPFCFRCERDLPWWRRIDGCPRCGTRRWARTGSVALSNDEDPFERGDPTGVCPGCLSSGSALHACHTLLRYEGAIRRWVPGMKRPISPLHAFGPAPRIVRAIEALADLLADEIRFDLSSRIDLVVSVPLHPARLRQRGFNHVDPIARRIAKGLGLAWHPRALARTRRTAPQASLSGDARVRNVRGAFTCVRRFDRDLRIALVDDVLTTGSTLDAAAEALLDAGALEVRGLTLAATLPTRLPGT